jgi:hypothetical protein
MVLEHLVGQFELGDIEITGLADKHKLPVIQEEYTIPRYVFT